MTLPFRRRHHDTESAHDRARDLASERLIGPIAEPDEAWLDGHLEGCGECRTEVEAFGEDRELLRELRIAPPPAPRDLWARTAAAIEREAGRSGGRASRRGRAPAAPARRWRLGGAPLGALSGALVVLVVVGASIFSRPGPVVLVPTPTAPAASAAPEPTPIAVTANGLNWIRTSAVGTYELTIAAVDRVCASDDKGCAPLQDEVVTTISLAQEPAAVVISPSSDQIVVVTNESSGSSVLVVPVGSPGPSPTPSSEPSGAPSPNATPTATPSAPTTPPPPPSGPPPTASPISPSPSPAGSPEPSIEPSAEPTPSPEPTPTGATAIATGVALVGEAAYSADAQWFAFAARPADGSAGSDIYIWHVGDPLATKVTDDGRSVFSGWAGGYVLGSRVAEELPSEVADGSPSPSASATTETSPAATAAPSESASPSPTPDIGPHFATTFVIDPETGIETDLAGPVAWRAVVDPTGQRVIYWDGTVVADGAGGWKLGSGRLVLDGWTALPEPTPSPSLDPLATPLPTEAASPSPTAAPSTAPSGDLSASPEPTPVSPGPAGDPTILLDETSAIVDFDARFDPTGTRLAVWVADAADPAIGRLHLFVIDPDTGAIDPDLAPLPGVPALRGFSIEAGRLAWVTPPGQDGDDSRISVLAWRDNVFGLAESNPAQRLQIVR